MWEYCELFQQFIWWCHYHIYNNVIINFSSWIVNICTRISYKKYIDRNSFCKIKYDRIKMLSFLFVIWSWYQSPSFPNEELNIPERYSYENFCIPWEKTFKESECNIPLVCCKCISNSSECFITNYSLI